LIGCRLPRLPTDEHGACLVDLRAVPTLNLHLLPSVIPDKPSGIVIKFCPEIGSGHGHVATMPEFYIEERCLTCRGAYPLKHYDDFGKSLYFAGAGWRFGVAFGVVINNPGCDPSRAARFNQIIYLIPVPWLILVSFKKRVDIVKHDNLNRPLLWTDPIEAFRYLLRC
jgi:hypothetical protein